MNIYQRLTQDHEVQKELAGKIARTSGDSEERRRLFEQFKTEAEAHAAAEEQTLYATLIEQPEAQEKARHSIHEHKEAADLLKELGELEMSSGGWLQKFNKLKGELVHHINEEEREVFTQARKLIAESEAERLAQKFDDRKEAEVQSV